LQCLKFANIREFYEILKICFITSTVTANFGNPQNNVVDYTEATTEWEQWAVEDSDSDTGEDSEAAGDSWTW